MMKTKTKLKLKNISKTATKTKTKKYVNTKITLLEGPNFPDASLYVYARTIWPTTTKYGRVDLTLVGRACF